MVDQSVLRDRVLRYWEYVDQDSGLAHELYHDDAVLEFPQSGERFEGLANFKEWRRQYPADLRFRIRRMTGRADLVVVEVSVSYNDGPWVRVSEFHGHDGVARCNETDNIGKQSHFEVRDARRNGDEVRAPAPRSAGPRVVSASG